MFMSSAALGGAFAFLVNMAIPDAHLSPGAYALVAMAAVFGAASRATFTFIVFAFEITGDYRAILPLMLACVIVDLMALRYLPSSIMTEKLARRGLRVPEDYEATVLKLVRVGDVMGKDVKPVPAEMSVAQLATTMSDGEVVWPCSTACQSLRRTVHWPESSRRAICCARSRTIASGDGEMTVLEAGVRDPVVAYADEPVLDALHRMIDRDIGRMPVVTRENPRQLAGYLNRANVLSAWGAAQLHEESVREHGWLKKWREPANGRST